MELGSKVSVGGVSEYRSRFRSAVVCGLSMRGLNEAANHVSFFFY